MEKSKGYSAHDVARTVIEKANASGRPVTNLQLQKILFFLQCEYMKNNDGKPLFDDDFEAWKYGPVVPRVYYDYSNFGGMQITEPVLRFVDNSREIVETQTMSDSDFGQIEDYFNELLNKPAWLLVDNSHKEGSPWAETFLGGYGMRDIIQKDVIKASCC